MNKFTLVNIDTSFESYQQLINLYNENKNNHFDTIELAFQQWFAANLSSALGGVLDKLVSGWNTVNFDNIPPNIKTIIQKNGFLSHFGFERQIDIYNTTINYLKLKPTDGRFFSQLCDKRIVEPPRIAGYDFSFKEKNY